MSGTAQQHNERECWCGIDHGREQERYATWVCSKHGRWTRIMRPEGDTLRPCPECAALSPAPSIKSNRPATGLTT